MPRKPIEAPSITFCDACEFADLCCGCPIEDWRTATDDQRRRCLDENCPPCPVKEA